MYSKFPLLKLTKNGVNIMLDQVTKKTAVWDQN